MRKPRPVSSLALSLLLLAGVPLAGCTQEVSRMDPELAAQAFPDDARMAELAAAVRAGNVDEVERLVATVDLDARGDRDVTMLQWAILTDSHEGFVALLDAGADPHAMGMNGVSAVHSAAFSPSPEFLGSLSERGFNPSIPAAAGGYGPLVSAMMSGNDDHVTSLLRAGADPDQMDEVGNTPLHVAGQMGISRLALALLEAGANPRLRNAQGATFDEYLFDRNDTDVTPEAGDYRAKIRQLLEDGTQEHASPVR